MRIEMAVHVMNWRVYKKMGRVSAGLRSEFW